MTHKIKLIDYYYENESGVYVEIDGVRLFNDGNYTFNCLHEILKKLDVDFKIEYEQEVEERKVVTRKMKLVEDNE